MVVRTIPRGASTYVRMPQQDERLDLLMKQSRRNSARSKARPPRSP
jgi:hypothetical protein